MLQETEYFLAYGFLEPIGKRQRDDHYRHADHSSGDRKPDDKTGKRLLLIKCYTVCYEACNLQIELFVYVLITRSDKSKPPEIFYLFF